MESKRVKVSRLVEEHVVGVGKVSVLKSNMYTLEEGEPSVFEKETRSAKNDAEAKGETTYKRKIVSYITHSCCNPSLYYLIYQLAPLSIDII